MKPQQFNVENLSNSGKGFFVYTEPMSGNLLSKEEIAERSGLAIGQRLIPITVNKGADSRSSTARKLAGLHPAKHRVIVLQEEWRWQLDQDRVTAKKAKKLSNKYN